MKVIKVNSIENGALTALDIIKKKTKIHIALTGGNFGRSFVDQIIKSGIDIGAWKVFTDERITNDNNEVNYIDLCNKLCLAKNFTSSNIFPLIMIIVKMHI